MDGLGPVLDRLRDEPPRIVCLPDLFVDHFVEAPSFDEAVAAWRTVHDRGGGNLARFPQRVVPGGNAVNTARALARLGVDAVFVGRTSAAGLALLEATIAREGVDITHVRDDGELAITLALEFGDERRNVMLNHPGSVARFGPDHLSEDAWRAIESADAVLVANWTNTRTHGTALATAVLDRGHPAGTLTYLDTSDPHARLGDVPDLVDRVGRSPKLDVWAMNEVELAVFGGEGHLTEAGGRLAKQLTATLDVHTTREAHSWDVHGHAASPARRIVPLRSTGAGDCWNAGNLVGHVLGLAATDRLDLAHLVAGAYLCSEDGRPVDRDGLVAFADAHRP